MIVRVISDECEGDFSGAEADTDEDCDEEFRDCSIVGVSLESEADIEGEFEAASEDEIEVE